jgi:hypothetical protein
MKKNYNCPAVEVTRINAIYTICDGSSTESFSIVNPGGVGADQGRAPKRGTPIFAN